VTVITPAAATKAGSETGARPGLQTGNVAAPTAGVAREVVAMVGGAVVIAMAL
jgi:phage-related protein